MESTFISLDGPVHHLDVPGPERGPTFLLIHGLGGHHQNWMRLTPLLAARGRVIVPDYRGFGRTPLGDHRTTLEHNTDLLKRLIDGVVGSDVILVGNSTGGVLSQRLAVAHPSLVRGVVLVDPALPGAASGVELKVAAGFAAILVPTLGEGVTRWRANRQGFEAIVRETLEICTVDPTRIPPDVLEAHLSMARERQSMPWAQTAFVQLTRSLLRALLRSKRYGAMVDEVTAPTLLIHGTQDRLVPVARARAMAERRPDWRFKEFEHLGHAPQLEDPDAVMAEIAAWLDGPDSRVLTGRARRDDPQRAAG